MQYVGQCVKVEFRLPCHFVIICYNFTTGLFDARCIFAIALTRRLLTLIFLEKCDIQIIVESYLK